MGSWRGSCVRELLLSVGLSCAVLLYGFVRGWPPPNPLTGLWRGRIAKQFRPITPPYKDCKKSRENLHPLLWCERSLIGARYRQSFLVPDSSEPAERCSTGPSILSSTNPSASFSVNSKCPSYRTCSGGPNTRPFLSFVVCRYFAGRAETGFGLIASLRMYPSCSPLSRLRNFTRPEGFVEPGHGMSPLSVSVVIWNPPLSETTDIQIKGRSLLYRFIAIAPRMKAKSETPRVSAFFNAPLPV